MHMDGWICTRSKGAKLYKTHIYTQASRLIGLQGLYSSSFNLSIIFRFRKGLLYVLYSCETCSGQFENEPYDPNTKQHTVKLTIAIIKSTNSNLNTTFHTPLMDCKSRRREAKEKWERNHSHTTYFIRFPVCMCECVCMCVCACFFFCTYTKRRCVCILRKELSKTKDTRRRFYFVRLVIVVM